eukprot:294180-Prymnesium_polylepis.1
MAPLSCSCLANVRQPQAKARGPACGVIQKARHRRDAPGAGVIPEAMSQASSRGSRHSSGGDET